MVRTTMGSIDRRSFLLDASLLCTLGALGSGRSLAGGSASAVAASKVDSYTLDFGYTNRLLGTYSVRLRNYGLAGKAMTIPGPILETRGGRTLRVLHRNRISTRAGIVDGDGVPAPAGLDPHNNPHNFDVTNLHVHGLQTIPHLFEPLGTTNPDAPPITINPQSSYAYDFPIPEDHPGGLYAYHPHQHGSAGVGVMSGATGAIIIRGEIDDVPEIKACREAVVAINSVYLNDNNQPFGRYGLSFDPYTAPPQGYSQEAFRLYTVNGAPVMKVDAPNFNGGTVTEAIRPPTLKMRPGEIVRLRFLNATAADAFQIVAGAGEMRWYSQDGVNFTSLVQTGTDPGNCVFTPPLGRSEVLLRAPDKKGEFFIHTLENNLVEMPTPEMKLLRVVVEGSPKSGMKFPSSLPKPMREYPLLQAKDVKRKRTILWTANSPYPSLVSGLAFQINNKSYENNQFIASPSVGDVEEWTLKNETPFGHPVHIHVNSMQVVDANLSATQPRFCDVLWMPANSEVSMRMRFKQWSGKTVMHCHIMPHEDQGMMTNILIKKRS